MSQISADIDRAEPTWRRGTTTMTHTRGKIAVRIDGVPTYQDDVSGAVMISGPLAVKLDGAMIGMLDAIEQSDSDVVPVRAGG